MIYFLYFTFAFACIHAGRSGPFIQNPLVIQFQNSVINHGDLSPFLANQDLMREVDDLDLSGAYRNAWENHYTDHLEALERESRVMTRILFKLAQTSNPIDDREIDTILIHILSLPSSMNLLNDRKMGQILFLWGCRHDHFQFIKTILDRDDLRRGLDDNTIGAALDIVSYGRNTRLVSLLTSHPKSAQASVLHLITTKSNKNYLEPIKSLLDPVHILEKLPRDQVAQIFDRLSEQGENALKVYVHFPDSFTLDRTYNFIENALLQRSRDVGAILLDDNLIKRFPKESSTDLVLLLAHFHQNGLLIYFLEKYYRDRNFNKAIYAAAVDASLESENWRIVHKYASLPGIIENIPIIEWNSIMKYASQETDVAVFDRLVDATLAHPHKEVVIPSYAIILMDGSKNDLLLARLLKNDRALGLISDDLVTYALNSLAASGRLGSLTEVLKSPNMEKRDFSRFIYSIIHSGIVNRQTVVVSYFSRPLSRYLLELSSQSLTDLLELAIKTGDAQTIVIMLKNKDFVGKMPTSVMHRLLDFAKESGHPSLGQILDSIQKEQMPEEIAQLTKGIASGIKLAH